MGSVPGSPLLIANSRQRHALRRWQLSVSPVMKLDSSLKRKRTTEAISGGLADPPERRVGHDPFHRLFGKNMGHLGLDQAGRHAVDAHVVRREGLAQQRVSAITPAFDDA